ncbi:hypothetical protein QL285_046414 [Trifolium repens]|nr:hypothetical protein QL285_046414 [Trifolium repens]
MPDATSYTHESFLSFPLLRSHYRKSLAMYSKNRLQIRLIENSPVFVRIRLPFFTLAYNFKFEFFISAKSYASLSHFHLHSHITCSHSSFLHMMSSIR